MPKKESTIYKIIQDSFGDYELMRETYIKEIGCESGKYKRGSREEALNDQKMHGWVWVLYNSVTNKFEIKVEKEADDFPSSPE